MAFQRRHLTSELVCEVQYRLPFGWKSRAYVNLMSWCVLYAWCLAQCGVWRLKHCTLKTDCFQVSCSEDKTKLCPFCPGVHQPANLVSVLYAVITQSHIHTLLHPNCTQSHSHNSECLMKRFCCSVRMLKWNVYLLFFVVLIFLQTNFEWNKYGIEWKIINLCTLCCLDFKAIQTA